MTTRKRLNKDAGEREAIDSFDEMEKDAQRRIAANGRKSSMRGIKLKISNMDPDYHYFWASDNEQSTGNVQDKLEQGYQFVRHEVGAHRGEVLQNRTKSTTLYAMRILKTDREELLKELRQAVNRTEVGLRDLEKNQYAADESGKGVTQEQETQSEFNPLMD